MKKIFIVPLLVGVFLTPTLAFANVGASSISVSSDYSTYSVEQLETLIAKLQRQLEETRKGTLCAVGNTDLSLGDGEGDDSKEQVKKLQSFLKEKGYFTYNATGYFGKLTRASLISFQKAVGVNQTGELNEETRQAIQTLRCKNAYNQAKGATEQYQKVKEQPTSTASGISRIKVWATGNLVEWTAKDGVSKQGFKVVWSKNPSPTYPNRDGDAYQYHDSPSATSTKLEGFNGPGTYYVRVCEYLGGACGIYSNEISLEL